MVVQLLKTLPRPKRFAKFCLMDLEAWPPSINLQLAYVGEPNRAWLGTIVTELTPYCNKMIPILHSSFEGKGMLLADRGSVHLPSQTLQGEAPVCVSTPLGF